MNDEAIAFGKQVREVGDKVHGTIVEEGTRLFGPNEHRQRKRFYEAVVGDQFYRLLHAAPNDDERQFMYERVMNLVQDLLAERATSGSRPWAPMPKRSM